MTAPPKDVMRQGDDVKSHPSARWCYWMCQPPNDSSTIACLFTSTLSNDRLPRERLKGFKGHWGERGMGYRATLKWVFPRCNISWYPISISPEPMAEYILAYWWLCLVRVVICNFPCWPIGYIMPWTAVNPVKQGFGKPLEGIPILCWRTQLSHVDWLLGNDVRAQRFPRAF